MRHEIRRAAIKMASATITLSVLSTLCAAALVAQTATSSSPPVRQLSVEDAVKLALEQNLGLQIEHVNPEIQDLAVAQARNARVPTFSSTVQDNRANTPATSAFSGGQSSIIDTSLSTEVGVTQTLPSGANYTVAWTSARATSTNIFNSFNPQLSSTVVLSVTQPLLRNFKIDDIRHQFDTSRKDRDASGIALEAAIVQTTRDVKNAYWDLTYQIDNLRAQQQSLDLSKQLLFDNEKRVQAGTMASLDIVEAQSEVARDDEGVIVAEAAIKQAEDRLRVLIFDPAMPDFWDVSIEPADIAPYQPHEVDLDAAVRRALDGRTDVRAAKTTLARDDINIRYFRNQSLPEVNAQASYSGSAVGGSALTPITTFPIVGPLERGVISQNGFGSIFGDVLSNAFPTWTVGLTVAYPIGTSAAETNLARAKLQSSQAEMQLKNLDLQIVAQVRDTARQVQTNEKRVESARAFRELSERRLDAEQKKFAAGIETSFFVFQAQRDLSQARTDEARATADYNKSLADFEAVQLAPLTGGR